MPAAPEVTAEGVLVTLVKAQNRDSYSALSAENILLRERLERAGLSGEGMPSGELALKQWRQAVELLSHAWRVCCGESTVESLREAMLRAHRVGPNVFVT